MSSSLCPSRADLWRVAIAESSAGESTPLRVTLATGAGFSPRIGPDYLLYVASAGTGESIWKISGAAAMQLWTGGRPHHWRPAVSADGRLIAFSVRQRGQSLLYAMGSDGSRAAYRVRLAELRGTPAWAS